MKVMSNEDDIMGMTPSTKRALKNSSTPKFTKNLTNVGKKIENVEYLLKIEQKNKKQLEEKYSKNIEKLESQIEKWENEMESNLKTLNEKEAKIFEIQKAQLETFRVEISKYENIMKEIKDKCLSVEQEIEKSKIEEEKCYNISNMLLEDYHAYSIEIGNLNKKVISLKESLKEIEKTYPKEFNFLLEDIKLEKDMNEMMIVKKSLNEEIESAEKNRKELVKIKEEKTEAQQNLISDIFLLSEAISRDKNDESLTKIEDFITKNISDMLQFEKLKILVQNYYTQKNFDLENEVNVLLIKNLTEKLKEMKNEFVSIKNEKLLNKAKVEKVIDELIKIATNNKKAVDSSRVENEINQRKAELDRMNNEINLLELNCKKKETLFNKYIIVLRSKCRKSSQESYIEMNPALVIETEFEEKVKEEVIRIIENDSLLSREEKVKNKNMIEIYIKDMINREKLIQNNLVKKKKYEENSENLLKEIEKLEESILLLENEISLKKSKVQEICMKEKIFLEKIEIRNRKLTTDLGSLGEAEFEKYTKANESVLKNMKRVYGNKILDKVFKVQKQKFLENVIMDHSYKKSKVNEFIRFITKFETLMEFYSTSKYGLEMAYQTAQNKYEAILGEIFSKIKEKDVLDESKEDLKSKVEEILHEQISEIEKEKKKLQYKYNISYYIEKVKEASQKVASLNKNKESLMKEYDNFSNLINEKEQKLYIEDLDLKNHYISLSIGEEAATVMPYKVNKSCDSANKMYNSSDNDELNNQENFDEIVKKSLVEYRNKDDMLLSNNDVLALVGDESLKEEKVVGNEQYKIQNNINNDNYNDNDKLDPFLSLAIEKIKPLVDGMNMYKKFNNNSMSGKIFDCNNARVNPPEACGFALRQIRLNCDEMVLEIKNCKNKHIENKIALTKLKGILLGSQAKSLLKQKKTKNSKANLEVDKLVSSEYIQFILLFKDGKMDIIAPSYQIFKNFEAALEEVIKLGGNLKDIINYLG